MRSPLPHILIALLLCAGAGGGYILWYHALQEKSASVADLDSQIASDTETKQRVAKVREALAEVASYEAGIQNYFVPETSVVSFITLLETKIKDARATSKVTSVSKAGTATEPALAITMTVAGDFEPVVNTVGAIEFAPYALAVTSFSLRRVDSDSSEKGEHSWIADLTLLVGSSPVATTTQP
jgi:hypothetical protein